MTLSTHVLDVAAGAPAAGVPVRLEVRRDDGWVEVSAGLTDADGRLRDWVSAASWVAGTYRLVFDTAAYQGAGAFFPEVALVFVAEGPGPLHVPLLLSPFGYTTYRGS